MVALDRIPEALRSELGASFPGRRLLGAWLYGSRAEGRDRADSDVDIAVHEYRRLDPAVVRTVVAHRLGDFEALCRELAAGD